MQDRPLRAKKSGWDGGLYLISPSARATGYLVMPMIFLRKRSSQDVIVQFFDCSVEELHLGTCNDDQPCLNYSVGSGKICQSVKGQRLRVHAAAGLQLTPAFIKRWFILAACCREGTLPTRRISTATTKPLDWVGATTFFLQKGLAAHSPGAGSAPPKPTLELTKPQACKCNQTNTGPPLARPY